MRKSVDEGLTGTDDPCIVKGSGALAPVTKRRRFLIIEIEIGDVRGDSLIRRFSGRRGESTLTFSIVIRIRCHARQRGSVSRELINSIGEFDPGSGRTLAACLTHASGATNQASAWGKAANG